MRGRRTTALWVGICALFIANGVVLVATPAEDVAIEPLPTTTPTSTPVVSGAPTPRDPGIRLEPGENIARAIARHPPGTRFDLAPGRHVLRAPLRPKDGQWFVGDPGTILTGKDRTTFAFAGRARDVVIRRLVITDFAPPRQEAAVQAKDGTGWVIEDNEVRQSAAAGIYAGPGARVRRNVVHHNHQIGVKAQGADVLVEDNEIAYNNYREEFDWGWEAGGSKFVRTDGLVLRNNVVHHNAGPGLWVDIDNIRTTIVGNVVEDNYDNGIFHEISYDAVIRDNVVRRNGFKRRFEWLNGAGIFISASGGVADGTIEVAHNLVADNVNGIALQQQERGAGAHGPHVVRNVWVHDNVIRDSGASGAVEDVRGNKMFAGSNIVFEDNRYVVAEERAWRWDGRDLDWQAWRRHGHDRDGTARRA